MAQHNITGKSGEDAAVDFLKRQKYIILAKNYRTKIGELDIVAKEGGQIVFVEVKTRSNNNFGSPSEAITKKKLHSLIQAAEWVVSQGKSMGIDRIKSYVPGRAEPPRFT